MKPATSYKISQWLQILQEPYKTKAVKAWEGRTNKNLWPDKKAQTLRFAVQYGFHWIYTIEGADYWYSLFLALKTNPKEFV